MILCVERLHDICVWKGCVIFLTHSLRLPDLFLWRFLCEELFVIFLLRDCMISCMKRLHDFLCEEVV